MACNRREDRDRRDRDRDRNRGDRDKGQYRDRDRGRGDRGDRGRDSFQNRAAPRRWVSVSSCVPDGSFNA